MPSQKTALFSHVTSHSLGEMYQCFTALCSDHHHGYLPKRHIPDYSSFHSHRQENIKTDTLGQSCTHMASSAKKETANNWAEE